MGSYDAPVRATLHRFTDLAYSRVLRADRYYPDGFGDRGRLKELVQEMGALRASASEPSIDVRWSGLERHALGVSVRTGQFTSPLSAALPDESREATIELILPHGSRRSALQASSSPPVVIVFAATAEEGFARRRLLMGPLARRGVGSVLLENPMYGARRPAGQKAGILRTVADQFAMNLATVREGRALVRWLRDRGFGQLALTGYSQGGMMAAFVAALLPSPIAVVACASAQSVSSIFLEGTLTDGFDWPRLSRDTGDLASARRLFAECLEPLTLAALPPPIAPELAIILAGRHDAFVLPHEPARLHRQWQGSELRWLEAGHITSLLFHGGAHRRAMLDALQRQARRTRP
jgi:hypothetical protein